MKGTSKKSQKGVLKAYPKLSSRSIRVTPKNRTTAVTSVRGATTARHVNVPAAAKVMKVAAAKRYNLKQTVRYYG